MKKILYLVVLCFIMITCCSSVNAQTGGHSADDAINWLKSQNGKALDYDGASGAQCVDLLAYYYKYLGNTFGTKNSAGQKIGGGNADAYLSNGLPDGWKRLTGVAPQKGDILVWPSANMHVAIYESEYSSWHQNFNKKMYVHQETYSMSGKYSCIIRPDFDTLAVGALDSCAGGWGEIGLSGWAFDADIPKDALTIHVYADSTHIGTLTANQSREDVGKAYPGVGNYHGFSGTIKTKAYGTHTIIVYALGTNNQNPEIGRKTVTIYQDKTAPIISDVKITNVTTEGYRISCTATDNIGVTKVQFPTWTDNNGQDDLIWHDAVKSGNTYYYDVKISEHKNERGGYTTHIYAWDEAGNQVSFGICQTVPNPTYKINYVMNGGTNSKNNPSLYSYGVGVSKFTDPTRSGYSFVGWYSDNKFTKRVTSISSNSIGDITLYANWIQKKKIQNTITAKDITITAKTKSQTVNINASALGGAKLSYSGKKAKVNSKGVATIPAKYVGCLIIKVTSAATNDYLQTTKDVRIYVQPLAPTLKKVTSKYKKTIYVNWSTVKICDGYEVWYSTRQDMKNAKCVNVKGSNKKSVEFKKASGKTYYIRVRAYKKVNGNKNYSEYSNRKKVKVK